MGAATTSSDPVIHGRPERAPRGPYDVVVVGGGVHGAFVALEAARRGLRPLLLERADFGGATTFNSLRIVHGGLRYLQSGNAGRFRTSVAERRWLLARFPSLVRPLACLMPLPGTGLRRPAVMRVALAVNDAFSWDRNRGVPSGSRIPGGEVLDATETRRHVPAWGDRPLKGGARWYDAEMVDSARLLMEVLRWATGRGGVCLNYTEVEDLVVEGNTVVGVVARDRLADRSLSYRAKLVVDCRGTGSEVFGRSRGAEGPATFPPSLAFNLVLRDPPPGGVAAAVSPAAGDGGTYFVRPWKGRCLAGTYHAPRPPGTSVVDVSAGEVDHFLEDLRASLPEWDVGREDVREVLAGLVPVREPGSVRLATSPVVHDHSVGGGPARLVTVRGVKYTTARHVAESALRRGWERVGGSLPSPSGDEAPKTRARVTAGEIASLTRERPDEARRFVERIVREEAVTRPGDLLRRRTDWALSADDPRALLRLLEEWLPGS